MSNKLLCTVPEAAELLCITRPTVYKLMKAGRLHSLKFGKARRIPLSEVHKLIKTAA